MRRALVALLALLLASPASAIKCRRPFASNVALGHGYDNNFAAAGCKDWACKGTCYNTHSGSDFPIPLGTDVLAAATGKVIKVVQGCPDKGYYGSPCGGKCGNYVKLSHSGGTNTLYCHMKNKSITVKVGQTVACGTKIGKSASSGSSTGPHVHFGWYPGGGTAKDPFTGSCSNGGGAWVNQGKYPGKPSTTCEVKCACTPGKTESAACGNCGKKTRKCASSCQWGAWSACGGQGTCAAGKSESATCGNCGTKTRKCSAKCAWGAYGACTGEGVCAAGKVEKAGCGNCGEKARTCSKTCGWGAFGACGGEGPCAPGAVDAGGCGNCGAHSRTCGAACQWGEFSACAGEGPCNAGAVESAACGNCGQRSRTCGAACQWGDFGSCAGEGPCAPGAAESSACGNCGEHTRSCDATCTWGEYGACQGEGPCAPGTTEDAPCCDCGTRSRTCDAACEWAELGACTGPNPPGDPKCKTEQPGDCAAGVQRCVDGCLTCVADAVPSEEVCDAHDNDCDGGEDEDALVLGDPPPPYAAQLLDLTAPEALAPGEEGEVTAVFSNVGTAPWPGASTWLTATGPDGAGSPLRDPETWPAFDVPVAAAAEVPPGETASLAFAVRMPEAAGTAGAVPVATRFELTVAGKPVLCPVAAFVVDPDLALAPPVEDLPGASDPAAPSPEPQGAEIGVTPPTLAEEAKSPMPPTSGESSGCAAVPASAQGAALLLAVAALLLLGRRRLRA